MTPKADAILMQIGALVVGEAAGRDPAWTGLSLVARISPSVNELYGYLYGGDGAARPYAPSADEIEDLLEDLQLETQVSGKGTWKAALVKVDRAREKIDVEFEYDDEARWSDAGIAATRLPDEIRP